MEMVEHASTSIGATFGHKCIWDMPVSDEQIFLNFDF
jgi:hypothetical protein